MTSREILHSLFTEAVQSAMPDHMLRRAVTLSGNTLTVMGKSYFLRESQDIHLFGSGKASLRAALAMEEILDGRIAGGLVICNDDCGHLKKIDRFVSAHPIPDERSLKAAEMMIQALSSLSVNDVFIYLLSGGTSSLMEKPVPPLDLAGLQAISAMCLQRGMTIEEINTVRKHLSLIKGGHLASLTPAKGIVLVVSDVIGDDLETIGSAPLYFDRSRFRDAAAVLSRHGLWEGEGSLKAVKTLIEKGMAGELAETPKSPPHHVDHVIVGSNFESLRSVKAKAESMGIEAHIMTSRLRGEAREAAGTIVAVGEEILSSANPLTPPVCLLFGGETTVTVRGQGRGGRNQEMCLAALKEIRDRKGLFFLSAATDGIDGNSDAAGAIVDHCSYERIQQLQLSMDDYLNDNDSYSLLKQTGDLIVTGPTGTNVMDVTLLFIVLS